MSDAACAKCHDGFKAPDVYDEGFHSSARIGAGYCNVCHYEGRGTNGFADSATFVHRIHAGKDLTKVTTGASTTGYKAINPYVASGYPHLVLRRGSLHLHGPPALLRLHVPRPRRHLPAGYPQLRGVP